MQRRLMLLLFVLGLSSTVLYAQEEATPFQSMTLNDLAAFKPTTPNWQVAGNATSDRATRWSFAYEEGNGVLINAQTEEAKGHLFTAWDHADLELDLEVMMPPGSNSGIYFQSRYEIQLLDSWGVKEPQQSDMGGIYQRWDDTRPEGERGYEGHAPPVNVARAPGLWQHLNIVFQAPRFNAQGNKVRDARFVRVTLNGIVLHEDVPVTGPTRAAADESTEVAAAPLMIQGDHGPVAFRNIRYRMFDTAPVALSNLVYNYYRGDFPHQMPALDELSLVKSEATDVVSSEKADTTKLFALRFEGDIEVPRTGDYTFEVVHSARFALDVNGDLLLNDQTGEDISRVGEFPRRTATVRLRKGQHNFALTYAKGLWHNVPTALGWYVSGPGVLRTQLTASGSVPDDAFSAYQIDVEQRPIVQRNFVVHGEEKRTHAISVGFPGGLHYAYDMGTGGLLHLWKGSFIDTSTMWYQRGNMQSAVALGSLIERAGNPVIYMGNPGDLEIADFVFKRYRLDDEGRPAFEYEAGGITVQDAIVPDDEQKFLERTLTMSGQTGDDTVWCVLAESENVQALGSGRYALDDQRIYLEVDPETEVSMLEQDGRTALAVPLSFPNGTATLTYNLVW